MTRRFERLAAAIARYSLGRAILEIGPGDGELAQILTDQGYDYTGIDRKPRFEHPDVSAVDFMEFETDRRFDCVVTQYVLHHAPDMSAFVDRMVGFTKPAGVIAVGDYGWERCDDPVFRAERADLHTSAAVIGVLDGMLQRVFYEDVPYKDGDDAIGFIWIGRRRAR